MSKSFILKSRSSSSETERMMPAENDSNRKEIDHFKFEMRECVKYVYEEKNKNNAQKLECLHCKRSKQTHSDGTIKKDESIKKDEFYQQCTKSKPTNAYGEISLPNLTFKKSKFIRVKVDTPSKEMAEYMLSKDGFGLKEPDLIISVTGGAKTLALDEEISYAFKTGLMKVAKGNNAWIISGGTDTGVMRLVGDAVVEEFQHEDVPVIAVATWGAIYDEQTNFPPTKNPDPKGEKRKANAAINANHSHFIFVDDGSFREFGVDVDFRTNLEKHIANKEEGKIPMVLIVVGGGPNTLKTIKNAVENKFPVVLIEKSGFATDLIIQLSSLPRAEQSKEKINERISKTKEIKNAKDDERTEYSNYLEIILNDANKYFLNVFKVNKGGTEQSIEPIIVEALSRAAKKNAEENNEDSQAIYKRIQMGVNLGLYDYAKEELKIAMIENEKDHKTQLQSLLELALIENKPNFVSLILQQEINLEEFCILERLKLLYNAELEKGKPKTEEPFLTYLKKEKKIKQNQNNNDSFVWKHIKEFLERRFETFIPSKWLPGFSNPAIEDSSKFAEKEFNLFLWCILSNRIEIAKIFWGMGKYQICNALMASHILKFFANELPDFAEKLQKSADEFEDLAIGVVRVFDENTRDVINDTLIVRYLEPIDMDCLELAVTCGCERFMSEPTIQKALGEIWHGKLCDTDQLTSLETELSKCQQELNKKKGYIYTLLFEYKENNNSESSIENKSNDSSENSRSPSTHINSTNINFSKIEYILLIWIITFFIEELRQIFKVNLTSNFKLSSDSRKTNRFKKYIRHQWNILDAIVCILFFVGFFLKFLSTRWTVLFIWARIVLSLDLILWFIRGLHFCLLIKDLGPKLVMIRRMIFDLLFFLIICGIFVLSFGIALEVITDTQQDSSERVIGMLNTAYWPIYGEIPLLDKIKDKCDKEKEECIQNLSRYVAYILLMIYLVIANVLLLNILIAMFSSTYAEVQNKSGIIWKNQRYHLILEYVDSPLLPPPLSLIDYVLRIIQTCLCKTNAKSNENLNIEDGNKISKAENNQNQNIGGDYMDALLDYEQKCCKKLLKEIRSRRVEVGDNKIAEINEKN